MNNVKIKRSIEGLIMVVLGVICLILSLKIRNNPVKVQGALNILVQAKMLPLVVSVLIIILGVMLIMQLEKGLLVTPAISKETFVRVLILTVITLAYLLITYKVGFLIPTFVYCLAMLFYLNWKQKNPVLLVVAAVIYSAVTLFLVPWILNLNLML